MGLLKERMVTSPDVHDLPYVPCQARRAEQAAGMLRRRCILTPIRDVPCGDGVTATCTA
jgi:hypothetical protein